MNINTEKLEALLARAATVLEKLDALLPATTSAPDWKSAVAFRWRKRNGRGMLEAIKHPHQITFDDLKDVDDQKARLEANTRQFLQGKPANNVLLSGARGTGKSSLVKAALMRFAKQGLRLIEVDKADLIDLPDIAEIIAARPERFIIFSDDLSFEANDPGYKALKSVLDGALAAGSDNLLVYATSNRRHLMPETMSENLETKHTEDGEIHPGETTDEKNSLSERFGLWLSFYPFDQDQYLRIAAHWVSVLVPGKQPEDDMRHAALLWTLERGSRSGRVAYQFAKDWAAKHSKAPKRRR